MVFRPCIPTGTSALAQVSQSILLGTWYLLTPAELNLDYRIKDVTARFLQCKVIVSPFAANSYLSLVLTSFVRLTSIVPGCYPIVF